MGYMAEEESESMAGCTANVCIVTKEKIVCANSGDSRSVLKRKEVDNLWEYLGKFAFECGS